MTIDPQMAVNMLVAIGIPLLGLAAAWGSLWTELRSIRRQFDVINARDSSQDLRLTELEKAVARMQVTGHQL